MTPSPPHLTHPKYRADIDGLRAVAVLSVVAFHAFPSMVRGGFIGVDVFFVISGYLISTIIFENLDKGTFRFSEFYARRVKRIFPALLLVVIASYFVGWFSLMADEYAALGKHIAGGAGFVSNFVLWSESGYFDNAAETKPLLHLWSLGIEEQFYILWPFVLWFAWKIRLNFIVPTLVIAAISFLSNINGIEKDAVSTFYWPQSRFWELLTGSSLAWFVLYGKGTTKPLGPTTPAESARTSQKTKFETLGRVLANAYAWLGFLLLAYGFGTISSSTNFPGKWAIVPVLGAALIILAGPKSWINRKILANKVVAWFGLISFPLYLWHWPLLSFARIIEGEVPTGTVRVAAVVLSVILAWLTFEFVERRIRSRPPEESTVIFLLVPMILLGFLGYGTYIREGFRFRSVVKSYEAVLATIQNNPLREECHLPQTIESLSKEPCEYFFPNPAVAVVGNSHAPEIAYALAEELRPYNQGVMHHSMSGCPHSYLMNGRAKDVTTSGICFDWHARVVETITRSPNIKYVVLSYRNELYLDNEVFVKSLLDMMSVFLAAEKKVIWILQAPMPKKHIKDYLRTDYRANAVIHTDVLGSTLSDWKTTYKHVARVLERRPQSVIVIDPANEFCRGEDCYVVKDNKALYFDDNHISLEGGRLIAKQILTKWYRADLE